MATEQFTSLERPPEFRGGSAEAYARELYRWAAKYHLMLEPLVKTSMQLQANLAGVAALTQTISNPPTKTEVEAVQAKINEIITASAAVP